MLLDRVAEQAREIVRPEREEALTRYGLLEEVANVRGTLARTKQERLQWQREVAEVREKLAASEMRIASNGTLPVNTISVASPAGVKERSGNFIIICISAEPFHRYRRAEDGCAPESRNASPVAERNAPGNASASKLPRRASSLLRSAL